MTEYSWLIAPITIGLFALVSNIILGRQVLLRGVVFIDLAMAQVAALAMVLVELYSGLETNVFIKLIASYLLTLPTALLLVYLERHLAAHLEALIGLLYVVAACLAVNLISTQAHGKELIDSLLNGRLLWADTRDIWPVVVVTIILCWVNWQKSAWLTGPAFYVLFALAIPPLVISLGVYLEFAALIMPALFALLFKPSQYWWAAFGIGLTGGAIGFFTSLWWDYPLGPSVVIAMASFGILGALCYWRLTVVKRPYSCVKQ
ncbi:metal ABC transporter permease [Vibrio tarriae]|uniref:metal ABC transporter permease n=1 Tax=Vibrio tarriae TaxID=2014742 RepID=UPI000DE3BF5E|nr:metal ABC transporter permease [Vibrio tarriae]RBM28728.1 zinc ABC transporter permease [Vibrio tarriae]RBM39065.1 zinc ABC transporter permease [Vibrio tarriae]